MIRRRKTLTQCRACYRSKRRERCGVSLSPIKAKTGGGDAISLAQIGRGHSSKQAMRQIATGRDRRNASPETRNAAKRNTIAGSVGINPDSAIPR
jgi:hypothetical protein